jgi:polar amino acid transport system substrate-binding protein
VALLFGPLSSGGRYAVTQKGPASMAHRWLARTAAVLLPLTLLAAACSSSSSKVGTGSGGTGGNTTTSGGAALASLLPAAVDSAKVINVGSDISYAPVESYKAGTQQAIGIDIDLCNAMVQQFGSDFSCKFQNTTFDNIIPSLMAQRFDIIMSAMSDTKDRQSKIDFVDYFNAGTSILVAKGNPKNIQSLDDLCGLVIGLQKGTTQEQLATTQKAKCATKGKSLTVLTYTTDTDAQLALKAGRSVADMNDFPVAAYTAQTSGGGNDFQVVGQQLSAGPYGVGVRKADTQLRDAIQAALKAIIANGTYDKILAQWNVSQGALKTAAINGGS